MDITKFVVSHREKALLYGDYSTYRSQLSTKLLNCRKKLGIATKNRGKFHPKVPPTAEQIAENNEHIQLQLLTAERAWAHAMSMKAAHSADTKGMTSHARSHIVSRLDKGARAAEALAETLSQEASGASSTDILEARAYASLLRGAALFEKQSWEPCVKNYSVARIIYSALSTSAKGDIFKELLSETIDPSIRYAAYQAQIPRTQPIATIALNAFQDASPELVERIEKQNPEVLKHGDTDAKQGTDGAPTTLTWRGRQVKIEDAAIAIAWAATGAARNQLSEKLTSAGALPPRQMAGLYDEILAASQDAVDATKQAIDELKAEGVPQSDSRMQGLQITRTAVNYETISWRIGRNRVLIGEDDGAKLSFGAPATKKRKQTETEQAADEPARVEPLGRQVARLKEKVVLYDGILQNLESIKELPGVANDQELSSRLDATSQYFTALKCLAISRSHSIAGNSVNALALVKHAQDLSKTASSVLSTQEDEDAFTPRSIQVTKRDISLLSEILAGELQRSRALVEISNSSTQPAKQKSANSSVPLSAQLSSYPVGGVDLENIVAYPPTLEPIPVKPLFLDVAWNYIEYPDKSVASQQQQPAAAKASSGKPTEPETKQQKKGWFGFGR
ncbi:signal recognition particle subunit SRP68 [Podospora australis]|uniref:Signal recognition particle subunit SRP68 n=1 Tax=Podospora australis TaxID=1536484 RepID=A0AAN6X9J4_9PEZI|nr:signal recognition particle subunit SRP68 [Podospora australis]